MTRIAPEDMTTLIQASEAKTVADTAATDLEEMQIAHLINEAANCGQTSVVCPRPISADLQDKLVNTYKYKLITPSPIAKTGDEIIIRWD